MATGNQVLLLMTENNPQLVRHSPKNHHEEAWNFTNVFVELFARREEDASKIYRAIGQKVAETRLNELLEQIKKAEKLRLEKDSYVITQISNLDTQDPQDLFILFQDLQYRIGSCLTRTIQSIEKSRHEHGCLEFHQIYKYKIIRAISGIETSNDDIPGTVIDIYNLSKNLVEDLFSRYLTSGVDHTALFKRVMAKYVRDSPSIPPQLDTRLIQIREASTSPRPFRGPKKEVADLESPLVYRSQPSKHRESLLNLPNTTTSMTGPLKETAAYQGAATKGNNISNSHHLTLLVSDRIQQRRKKRLELCLSTLLRRNFPIHLSIKTYHEDFIRHGPNPLGVGKSAYQKTEEEENTTIEGETIAPKENLKFFKKNRRYEDFEHNQQANSIDVTYERRGAREKNKILHDVTKIPRRNKFATLSVQKPFLFPCRDENFTIRNLAKNSILQEEMSKVPIHSTQRDSVVGSGKLIKSTQNHPGSSSVVNIPPSPHQGKQNFVGTTFSIQPLGKLTEFKPQQQQQQPSSAAINFHVVEARTLHKQRYNSNLIGCYKRIPLMQPLEREKRYVYGSRLETIGGEQTERPNWNKKIEDSLKIKAFENLRATEPSPEAANENATDQSSVKFFGKLPTLSKQVEAVLAKLPRSKEGKCRDKRGIKALKSPSPKHQTNAPILEKNHIKTSSQGTIDYRAYLEVIKQNNEYAKDIRQSVQRWKLPFEHHLNC